MVCRGPVRKFVVPHAFVLSPARLSILSTQGRWTRAWRHSWSLLTGPGVDLHSELVAVFARVAVLEIGAGALPGQSVHEGQILIELKGDDLAAKLDIAI